MNSARLVATLDKGISLAEKSWPGDRDMQLRQFASWLARDLGESPDARDVALSARIERMLQVGSEPVSTQPEVAK